MSVVVSKSVERGVVDSVEQLTNAAVHERREHASAPVLQSVTFTWPEVRRGNCHQTGGTLIFWEDGRGKWSCRTWTDKTHSGDEWDCWFCFTDQNGRDVLDPNYPQPTPYSTPILKSPRMSDGGPRYDWEREFVYPVSLFPVLLHASAASQFCSC